MTQHVVIDRRYRGPAESGNGGYVAGLVASFLDGPAEVTLRLPPPLERELAVEREGARVVLRDGDAVVAEGAAADVDVAPPPAPTAEQAAAATRLYAPIGPDSFRGCFSCGTIRDDDGLRILPGRVEGTPLVAAPWTAREPSVPILWAAIDCSGAYAVGEGERGAVVLGRMAARIERLPEEGEGCVVVGWPVGADGRKLYAGTALYGADGTPIAVARQTWIQPK